MVDQRRLHINPPRRTLFRTNLSDEVEKLSAKKRRRGINRGAVLQNCKNQEVCWIPESSQLAPRGRTKVQTSVASGSPFLTSRPVVRSRVLSMSEYRSATLA